MERRMSSASRSTGTVLRLVLLLLGLQVLTAACGTSEPSPFSSGDDDDASGEGLLDARIEIPPPPEGGLQGLLLDIEVPSGAEVFRCALFTYDGPDVGVDGMWVHHNSDFTHHTVLKGAHPDDDQHEDGASFDCGVPEEQKFRPVLFEGIRLGEPNGLGSDILLPEGWAFQLKSGQRWMVEGHYINVRPEPVLVSNGISLGLLPAEEVTEYVAAWTHDAGNFEIPPGDGVEVQFECSWDQPATVISVTGHMHDLGVSYTIDWNRSDGSERIYHEPEWNPAWRSNPNILYWPMGEEVMNPGDSFTHTCVWDNDSGETLGFPQEMCTAFGVVRGYSEAIHCVPLDPR